MPTFTYDKKDLLQLIGKKLSDRELEKIINSIKPEVEWITKKEITIEHTPDRPDMFGIEGLARSIKYYLGIYKKIRKSKLLKPKVSVKVEKVKIRPFVGCAVVRNVKLNDRFIRSLMHIQDALTDTLGRKRKKVAIGIHDLDKIHFPVIYTSVPPTEKMIPLGGNYEMSLKEILEKEEKGREYGYIIKNSKKWPVFLDKRGIISFPPILNSERTKVTKNTKNLFLELTGLDERTLNQCLNILVTNFTERGCKIEKVIIDYPSRKITLPKLEEEKVRVEIELIGNLIGIELPGKEIIRILRKMGFDGKLKGKYVEVKIPPYRADILHKVDIVEDIAIGYGIENLEPQIPNLQTVGKIHPLEKFSSRIRVLMVGLGMEEIMRPILSSKEKQFDKMKIKPKNWIEIENPVSREYSIPRVWLLPSLLEFLSLNQNVEYPQKIFEIGDVIIRDEKNETRTRNFKKIAGAIANSKVNYEEILAIVDSIFSALKFSYKIKKTEHPSFIKGRVANILVENKKVGILGEIHPEILRNWNLEMPTVAFELDLEFLYKLSTKPTSYPFKK